MSETTMNFTFFEYTTDIYGHYQMMNSIPDHRVNISSALNRTSKSEVPFIAPTDGPDFLLRKYSLPFLCVVGFLGNTLSAFLFLGKSLRKFSCCVFLGVRSIADTGFLATLLIVWLDFIDVRIFHSDGVCHMVVFLSYICCFVAVWCVVFVTVENYVRICHPLVIKMYCSSKTAITIIFVLIFVSICLYNMPLWSNEILELSQKQYCMTKKKFRNHELVLTYIDTAMTLIIPLLIILTLMLIIVYKGVQDSKRKLRLGHHGSKYIRRPSYGTVAALLTAVSITFVFLHTPIHIFRLKVIIETVTGRYNVASQADRTIGNILQVLYYLNSSANFLVYFICGRNFRRVCREILKRKIAHILYCCNDDSQNGDRVSDSGTSQILVVFEKSSSNSMKSIRRCSYVR